MNREALKLAKQIADKTGINLQSATNWVHFYHSQRSCGKVMLGNVFTTVCHSVHRGGLCRGSLLGGLCPGGLCPGGVSYQGVSRRGLCPGGVSVWGVSVQGGPCQGDSPPHTVKSGWYASYWNAILYSSVLFLLPS